MDTEKSFPILVTGATGYIGSHIIKNLLDKGYKVRGTVRSLSKTDTYNFLYDLTDDKNQLELVEADLLKPTSWEAAARGCKLVIHAAGPNLSYEPRNANELIKPAVDGTLNVLNAALKEGVRKSVITSSIGTMWIGNEDKVVTEEETWTDESKCDAFHKSKILAEKAVMEFWAKHKDQMEIAIINPGFALGPVLTTSKRSSVEIIMKLMTEKMPALPHFCLAAVDVRDVAEAHVRALFAKNNSGKRYIVSGQPMWFEKMADILRGEFGPYGYKITETLVPSNYLKYVAWFDSGVKKLLPYLNREMKYDNSLSVKELGIKYRNPEQTLLDMGYSLIKHKIIPDKVNSKAANLMMYKDKNW